jgi:ankyrin repeat protein
MNAIRYNDKERVLEFIRRGIDLNVISDAGKTIISAATVLSGNPSSRSLEIITILLDAEGATNTSRLQDHLLEAAASSLDLAPDIINFLAKRGVDVNMKLIGDYGSALAAAAGRGLPSTIRALLDAGADVNLQLKRGHYGSALAAAVDSGSPSTIRVLLDAGADVNLQLKYGTYGSALAAAADSGSPSTIRVLLDAGADVNLQLQHGHYGSALAAAAAGFSPETIRLLIQVGADVNMQLEHGEYGSALAAACSKEAVNELLQGGAYVNMDIKHGGYRNALAAALHKTRDTVESLLRAGAVIGPFASTQIKRSDPVTKWILGEAPMIRQFIINWELPSIMEGVEDMETHLSNMGTLTRKVDTVALASM